MRANLNQQAAEAWDQVCGMRIVRISAGVVATAGMITASGHVNSAITEGHWVDRSLDGFLFLAALPCIYLLLVVTLLGRSWRRAFPRWFWRPIGRYAHKRMTDQRSTPATSSAEDDPGNSLDEGRQDTSSQR